VTRSELDNADRLKLSLDCVCVGREFELPVPPVDVGRGPLGVLGNVEQIRLNIRLRVGVL
jgi:hypothetical protein